MRRCHHYLVIFTYLSSFGFYINPAVAASSDRTVLLLKVAQANSSDITSPANLTVGSTGEDVKLLQTQLRKLGYYNGIADGQFGATTRLAVIEFQQKKGLVADGIAGSQTRKLIKAETLKQDNFLSTPTPEPLSEETSSPKQESSLSSFIKLGLIAMGILAGVGTLFYVIQWFRYSKRLRNSAAYDDDIDDDTEINRPSGNRFADINQEQKYLPPSDREDEPPTIAPSSKLIPTETTSRLTKINVIDELIGDLESSNPTRRRKAIWELGQKGDSRAIQPLVEQMTDADSQQRSLILAALSEIGTRTLKPMNRALAVSMQDESPEVRKNAIRDLTRVYDMMAQISQMLSMAMEDEDPEVQETAKYAISQMNRIRVVPSEEPETRIQYPQEWEDSEQ
ncbi:MAG: peptidoglycan-binding protein [Rivularia sp. (in: Bacteria)]|nr:peptidoglycan-binding protein [Rivularia sp. MS3]